MSYLLPHLRSGYAVDQAILAVSGRWERPRWTRGCRDACARQPPYPSLA